MIESFFLYTLSIYMLSESVQNYSLRVPYLIGTKCYFLYDYSQLPINRVILYGINAQQWN